MIIRVYIDDIDGKQLFTYTFNFYDLKERKIFAEQSHSALKAGQSVTTHKEHL